MRTDVLPSHQFSKSPPFLVNLPYPHCSSQIFNRSSNFFFPLFFLHSLLLGIWTVGHSGPLSRSPSLFSKSLHFLSYPYTSSQIFHRSSKKFSFLHPLLLCFWTVCHSGPLSSLPVPFFVLFFLIHLHPSSTDPSNFLLSPSLIPWYPDSPSFYQFFQDGGSTPTSSPNSHDHSS